MSEYLFLSRVAIMIQTQNVNISVGIAHEKDEFKTSIWPPAI